MSTIDLRELAKSLMFAEKAKEEAEELKLDNKHLYEVNAEYAEKYQKDRATISNLERKVQELEEGIKNLSGALIGRGDTIKECFSKLGIDLYPSLENLIEAFYRHQDFSDSHIDLLEEKIRKIEQSKNPEVDWTNFVSWDELSRMTINEIMEKVYKNVN